MSLGGFFKDNVRFSRARYERRLEAMVSNFYHTVTRSPSYEPILRLVAWMER